MALSCGSGQDDDNVVTCSLSVLWLWVSDDDEADDQDIDNAEAAVEELIHQGDSRGLQLQPLWIVRTAAVS